MLLFLYQILYETADKYSIMIGLLIKYIANNYKIYFYRLAMNNKIALLLCLLMVSAPIAGCVGGNDDTTSDSDEQLDDWNVYFAATSADLPECNDVTDGRLYYVESSQEFEVCTITNGWQVITIQGADGADGQDGAPGADGADGQDGAPGADGVDGISTLIRVLSSTGCTTGGNTFEVGDDLNGDGVLDLTEVVLTLDICNGADGADGQDGAPGADGADGQDGAPGADGADGMNAIIETMTEPAGTNCANGGVKIQVGIDTNSDGVLQPTEINPAQTQYVCDGGSTVNTLLTSVTVPSLTLCDAGGRIVSHGLDNGDNGGTAANGQLESGEIDFSTTYCTSYTIELFIDIDTRTQTNGNGYGSSPLEMIEHNGILYFSADDDAHGRELWQSDGTVTGTSLVADIRTGSDDGYPQHATMLGDVMYFIANDGTTGQEIWTYDTAAPISTTNPSLLADLRTGTSGADIYYGFTEFQGSLYFGANDGVNGRELWKADPTTGLTMVKDIRPGSDSSDLNQISVAGDGIYFRAQDGTNGYEMWRSDGSTVGTYMVANLNPGTGDSYPRCFTDFGDDRILFEANDGAHGHELWMYDSSSAASATNPHMVVDLRTGSDSSTPCGYEGESYPTRDGLAVLFPYTANYGREIWITDGTSQGTYLHTDIRPGTDTGIYDGLCEDPEDSIFGNRLYFIAYTQARGSELFAYDFAENTTTALPEVNPGTDSGVYNDCMMGDPLILAELDGQIYFRAYQNNFGGELFRYNTVDNITEMVQDYNPGTGSGNYAYSAGRMIAYGDTLFWTCNNDAHGSELCHLGTNTGITYTD